MRPLSQNTFLGTKNYIEGLVENDKELEEKIDNLHESLDQE